MHAFIHSLINAHRGHSSLGPIMDKLPMNIIICFLVDFFISIGEIPRRKLLSPRVGIGYYLDFIIL